MAQTNTTKKTPRDLLRMVVRRWKLFAIVAGVCCTVALLGSFAMERRFTGTAILRRVTEGMETSGTRQTREVFLETVRQDLTSYASMEHVVQELDLLAGLPQNSEGRLTDAGEAQKQSLITGLVNQIGVSIPARSQTEDRVSVEFTDDDPYLAREVPNHLVTYYVRRESQEYKDRLSIRREWLAEQLEKEEKNLREVTRKKVAFEQDHVIPENMPDMREKGYQLADEIDSLERGLKEAKERRSVLEAMLRGEPETQPASQPTRTVKGPNPEYVQVEQDLRQKRRQLDLKRMEQKMTDAHPQIKSLKAQIALLEKELENTPPTAVLEEHYEVPDVSEQARVDLAQLKTQVREYTRELEITRQEYDRLNNTLRDYGETRNAYEQILREEEEVRAKVNSWNDELNDVDRQLGALLENQDMRLEVERLALRRVLPSEPGFGTIAMMSLGGAVAVAAGLLLLLNYLDGTFRTSEDAGRYLGVPVMGVVGEITTRKQRVRQRLSNFVVMPVIVGVLALAIGLAGLSVWVSLRRPPSEFPEFRQDPAEYVLEQLVAAPPADDQSRS
ncbi:MAG: GumC family protein [Planctomycetota bacterium]